RTLAGDCAAWQAAISVPRRCSTCLPPDHPSHLVTSPCFIHKALQSIGGAARLPLRWAAPSARLRRALLGLGQRGEPGADEREGDPGVVAGASAAALAERPTEARASVQGTAAGRAGGERGSTVVGHALAPSGEPRRCRHQTANSSNASALI